MFQNKLASFPSVIHLVTVGKTVHMGLGRFLLVAWSWLRYSATRLPYLQHVSGINNINKSQKLKQAHFTVLIMIVHFGVRSETKKIPITVIVT